MRAIQWFYGVTRLFAVCFTGLFRVGGVWHCFEIGHVNQTAAANVKFLQLQNKLVPTYISIFLKNGLYTRDQKPIELADQMGGTPTEIWESREYWSEVNAMQFLNDRLSKEEVYCRVFEKIKRNVREYASGYEERFDKFPEFTDTRCTK